MGKEMATTQAAGEKTNFYKIIKIQYKPLDSRQRECYHLTCARQINGWAHQMRKHRSCTWTTEEW